MADPKISILIPTYNRAALLTECLRSILRQEFSDFEAIVSDDCSTDDTALVPQRLGDPRIRYVRNPTNLGYGGNLSAGARHAGGEILFLMGHDDLLLPGALARTYAAFARDPAVGVVTRPYYWFERDSARPVRIVPPADPYHDRTLALSDGKTAIRTLFTSAGQLSGLAFRRSMMRVGFHPHIFTAHIYPFADILKRASAVYLKDYTVAVRIESSMTRHRPEIYRPSPTATWVEMFNTLYAGPQYAAARREAIEYITTTNFEGLLQLRNFASTSILVREIVILILTRPRNLLAPRFLVLATLSLCIPRVLLTRLTDAYKRQVLARMIGYNSSDRPALA